MHNKKMRIKEKIVVITGAHRGSGNQITKLFLSNNYKVYALDINFKKKIQYKKNMVCFKIDLAKLSQIKKFINFIKKKEKKN